MSIYYKEEGMEFPSRVFEESKELIINLDSSERKIKNLKNTPIRTSKNKIENDLNSTSYQQQQKIDLNDKMKPKTKLHDSLSNLFRRNVSQINICQDKQELIQNTFKKIFNSQTNPNLDLLIPPQIQVFSSKVVMYPKQSIFECEAQSVNIKDYISLHNVSVLILKQLRQNSNFLTNLTIKLINNINKSVICVSEFSKSQSQVFSSIKQTEVNITLLKQDDQRFMNQLLTIDFKHAQKAKEFQKILRQFKNQNIVTINEFTQSQKIKKLFLPPIDQQTEQKQTSEQCLQLSDHQSKIAQFKNQINHVQQNQLEKNSPIKKCVDDQPKTQNIQQKPEVEKIIINQQEPKSSIILPLLEQNHQIPISKQQSSVQKVESTQVQKPKQTFSLPNQQIDDDQDDLISQVINQSINNGQQQQLSDSMSMRRYTLKNDFGDRQGQHASNSKNVPPLDNNDKDDNEQQTLLDQLRKSQRIKPRDSGYSTPHSLRYSFQLPSDHSTIYETSRQYRDSSMSYQKQKPEEN